MIKISITGPESTGKSWLAEKLAGHYTTLWLPEYARKYLENINRQYTYEDILVIAQHQYEEEKTLEDKTELLFCDTDYCVTSIWCDVKYGKCHNWITSQLNKNNYALYLLCDVDLPWQYDPLREHPEMRKQLFEMYQNLLELKHFNYKVASGTGHERLLNAIRFVDEYLYSVNLSSLI
jgi:NadR type nicotinamide-nucleotide adenylyltransferase